MDGVARGIDLFNAILRSTQSEGKPIAAAALDIQKAFDSVSHQAIFQIIDLLDLHPGIKAYLKFIYLNSKTHLLFRGTRKRVLPSGQRGASG